MIQRAVDTFGELNVIFNNAGMNRPRDFMEVDEANFDEIVRVNTWGVIVCTQEAATTDDRAGLGREDRQHRIDREPTGLLGLRPLLRREVRHARRHAGDCPRPDRARNHRQRFAPGVVDTPMWVGLNEDIRAIHDQPAEANPMRDFATGTLIGRPASPAELAPFLVYLASPESDYMTGQMYMVDGGQILV